MERALLSENASPIASGPSIRGAVHPYPLQEAGLNIKREEERERFVAVDPETEKRYVIVRSVQIHDASTFGRHDREREGAETLQTTQGLDVNRISKSEFDVLDPARGRVRVVRTER